MYTVDVSVYWEEKVGLMTNLFDGWNKDEEIQVRKFVIVEMMDIPKEHISFYLKRDRWLYKFALEDDSNIEAFFGKEEAIRRKVNTIIKNCFYKEDYAWLIARCNKKGIENPGKKEICNCIKELLQEDTYAGLTNQEKESLAIYESIYFERIELFNGYVENLVGPNAYYNMLLEQWKTANEMAVNISVQRNNMNNFYVSMMSILIGGILFSDQLLGVNPWIRTVMYIVIMYMGVICCNKWFSQIENYKKMNGVKYAVINELERSLPAKVLLYEYMQTEKNVRKNKEVINFSKKEEEIVILFKRVIIGVTTIMIVSTWWEKMLELWKVIQNK